MQRILVVVRGSIDVEDLRRRCSAEMLGVSEPHELAMCYVLDDGHDGLEQAVGAQRILTAALRLVLGASAENVRVFVASERDGHRIDDCAREWGATVVIA